MDTREIINNFKFFGTNEEFEFDEFEINEKLEKNISICLDINYGTEQYMNIFTKYSTIVKHSTVIYLQSWTVDDMISYYNITTREIQNSFDAKIKPKMVRRRNQRNRFGKTN
jgi:hypothetical protein